MNQNEIDKKTKHQKKCIEEAFSETKNYNEAILYLYNIFNINIFSNDLTYDAEQFWYKKCAEYEQEI